MIIKFNLLPKEKVSPEAREISLIFLKVYISLLLFLLTFLTFLFYTTHNKITSLIQEKKQKEVILEDYKRIAIKVKEMERENEEIKKRIEIILTLRDAQGKNLKNLANVLRDVPASKLLFSNLKLDNSKAYIKGIGLDMDFLALYLQNLENNKEVIKALNLKTAQQKTIGDLKLIEFELEVSF